MITASRVATGLALAALLAALGACAAGNTTSSLATPATASASTAPGPPPAPAPVAPAPAQPAPAATADSAAPPQHLTATEINEKCWMRTEKFKADSLDKRMKFVDKCVDEMTRAQGGT